ncbi:hypothetical protein Rumeso_04537 [Rubellimicrobium mesophilum DSM 19309]|uniref:Uncharacterized protein n=1 Tax=Rubellimicrobium mesophilum DSM 19309 TaxID=442562 RepID=A0A017HHZ1_9RHOB|nr:quinol:electron acceptor oxidoreductase subunit ActD [Rubellimicrobium mesophilum]EYD73940.1 hypothetical protein Rumeso_04537 [Rubellimicrobium mesophilum DSM 19309]
MTRGLLATYDDPEALKDAARRMRGHGYSRLEAFSPFAVEGIDEALGAPPRRRACRSPCWWAGSSARP